MPKNGGRSHADIEQGFYNGHAHDHGDSDSSSNEEEEEYEEESRVSSESEVSSVEEDHCCSEVKVSVGERAEKDCRICHLGLEGKEAANCGGAVMLGCCCKDDLGVAHRQCAETWFKIRGNRICEICGSTARNIIGSGETEASELEIESNTSAAPVMASGETRRFWQGHRFLNFLLACLVFAFVISWLFHFNLPG